jgi:AcrR family transcriptional regulator
MSKNIIEEIRKGQILEATKKLILQKGYSNVSIKDIAVEMDMSPGILYHYFESKEVIFFEVLKQSFFSAPYRKVMETVTPLQNFPEKMIAYIDTVNESILEDIEFYILVVIYMSQVAYSPEIAELLQRFIRNLRLFVEEMLELAVEQGFITKATAQNLPELMMSMYMGLVLQYIADPEGIDLKQALSLQKQVILRYLQIEE